MIEIGFTGTRHGMTIAQLTQLSKILLVYHKKDDAIRCHHGMCVGADKEFHNLARTFDLDIKGHPPVNRKYLAQFRRDEFSSIAIARDYLVRNHDIVRESQILIATPQTPKEVRRSGTWATIRYSKKLGHHTVILFPDGTTGTY